MYGQVTIRSGARATIRSRSIARESPTRGSARAAGGQSEVSLTPSTRSPPPAANSSSVACGARLTIRRAGAASVTVTPVSSVACTAARAASGAAARRERRAGEGERQQRPRGARSRHRICARTPAKTVRAAGRVARRELVVLVEHVVGAREQRHVAAERPLRGQVDDRVAAHLHAVLGVVVAQRRGEDLEADAAPGRPGSPAPARRAGARAAAAARRCDRPPATAGRARRSASPRCRRAGRRPA